VFEVGCLNINMSCSMMWIGTRFKYGIAVKERFEFSI
jgi:hypothetical protein